MGVELDEHAEEAKCYEDVSRECIVCGTSPTVVVVDGVHTSHTDLCGACCFGEAACIDPKEWPSQGIWKGGASGRLS